MRGTRRGLRRRWMMRGSRGLRKALATCKCGWTWVSLLHLLSGKGSRRSFEIGEEEIDGARSPFAEPVAGLLAVLWCSRAWRSMEEGRLARPATDSRVVPCLRGLLFSLRSIAPPIRIFWLAAQGFSLRSGISQPATPSLRSFLSRSARLDSPPASLPMTTTHPFASPLSSASKKALRCSFKNPTSVPDMFVPVAALILIVDAHEAGRLHLGSNVSNLSGRHGRMDWSWRGKSQGGERRRQARAVQARAISREVVRRGMKEGREVELLQEAGVGQPLSIGVVNPCH